MAVWLARIVTLVWAGFWLCFGVGWAVASIYRGQECC